MQRCMLKLGHGGKHMFIHTHAAAMSGECPSTPAGVRRALKEFTIAGVTRDVPRPRGSAGDDWNDRSE